MRKQTRALAKSKARIVEGMDLGQIWAVSPYSPSGSWAAAEEGGASSPPPDY